jgi:hypothetical protein
MSVKNLLVNLCLGASLLGSSYAHAASPRSVCVFDPIGRSGDVFVNAQDMSSDFLSTGVSFNLKLYLNEQKAKQDFKQGLCDGMIITGLQAREFNRFAAAIEAPGIIKDYSNLEQILGIMASPKAAKYMRQGSVEIAGVYPAGAIYMIINKRSRATPRGLGGMRMINIDNSELINSFAQKVGASTVSGTTDNFAKIFKQGKVDITFAPMAILSAMELDKAIQYEGGILDTPIALLTLQLVINADRFPAGFGQQAREISLSQYERVLKVSRDAEAAVPTELWIKSVQDQDIWARIALSVRKEMMKRNYYHPKMIKILDKFRCGTDRLLEGC